MISVSLKDSCFAHAYSMGNGDLKIHSKYINWDRIGEHDVIFYTDNHLTSDLPYSYKNKINVAWILEPPAITCNIYNLNYTDWSKFNYVLTFNIDFMNQLNDSKKTKSIWCAPAGCWIYEEDRKIYNKTKNLSAIVSHKRKTEGHVLRHEIISKYKNKFDDVYGRGRNPISYKIEGLKDYRFSLVVENSKCDDFFTEKLFDCLVTGTIPIYWGTKNIGKYFDLNGFVIINNINDFDSIINLLNEDYYLSKIESVNKNFEIVKDYLNQEDWIYKTYKDLIFK